MRPNRTSTIAQIVLFAILFTFFLQVLTEFIQSIYAFGLLVTAFTIQLAAVLLLFSPLVLLFMHRAPSRPWIVALASVAIVGRLVEPLMNPGGRLVVCGLSVGAFLLLFPILAASRPRRSMAGWRPAAGLLMAAAFTIFVRSANSSLPLSESGIYLFVLWVLAVLAVRLMLTLELGQTRPAEMPTTRSPAMPEVPEKELSHEERRERSLQSLREGQQRTKEIAPVPAVAAREQEPPGGRVLSLCIGIFSVVLILYFGLAAPTVIARWTGYSYLGIVSVLPAAMTGFALLLSSTRFISRLTRPVVLGWNAAFVLMLVLTILPHQMAFPADASRYPLDAPAVSPLAQIPLYLMLIASPVIFLDFMLYVRQLSAEGPSLRRLGGTFALGALFLLVMVFLHVFTTIYDYAAPIGPLLRDRFWLVYLLAGLGLALPLFSVRDEMYSLGEPNLPGNFTQVIVGALALLAFVSILASSPQPAAMPEATSTLRLMTYNIQQGFDKIGDSDLPGQLAAMRRVGPDVLGLEESDTARIANGNVDAVRYFADHLGMYSYYGPTTTTGTFGIALLSRYPIQNPRTFFMYSAGEQTACIQASLLVNGKTYNVFVTHLGNGGPMIQLEEVLKRVEGLPNVILMGDFNFGPTTPQYALAAKSLADAWKVRWPSGHQISGPGSEGRIDLIFVSRGTQIVDSEYVPDPASDHPYLYAAIKPKARPGSG